MAVHGGSGVDFGVIEQLRRARPEAKFLELVHRLDSETSGLLLVAKRRSALVALQEQFRRRETGKTYAALVVGAWPAGSGSSTWRCTSTSTPPASAACAPSTTTMPTAAARSRWCASSRAWPGWTLLDVTIKTGRTHQIRVHLAHAGHPIAGDPKYGDFAVNRALARGGAVAGQRFERMFLHARRLRFEHPADGRTIELEAPLPAECAALLVALGAGAQAPAAAIP